MEIVVIKRWCISFDQLYSHTEIFQFQKLNVPVFPSFHFEDGSEPIYLTNPKRTIQHHETQSFVEQKSTLTIIPVSASLRLEERETLYPISNMTSTSHKQAIRQHLAHPIVEQMCSITAFRVIWRVPGGDVDQAWKSIVAHRKACDDIIMQNQNIDFFISNITGLCNKPSRKGEAPKNIYPGVAYWVVSADNVDHTTVLDRITTFVREQAVVKIIHCARQSDLCIDKVSSSLFSVLKDHKSGYVIRRMQESQQALAHAEEIGLPSRVYLPSRSKLKTLVMGAVSALNEARINLDLI